MTDGVKGRLGEVGICGSERTQIFDQPICSNATLDHDLPTNPSLTLLRGVNRENVSELNGRSNAAANRHLGTPVEIGLTG